VCSSDLSFNDVVVAPSAMISALGRFAGRTFGETRWD